MTRKLRIVMAASEAVPFAKTGGLADVAGTLPQALGKLGHDVRLIIPYYGCIKKAGLPVTDTGVSISASISNRAVSARIFQSSLNGGNTVYLVEKDAYYDRPELYGAADGDYQDNAERFCFFSKAVLAITKRLDLRPDVIHCHDWQTGLVSPLFALFEKSELKNTVTVFTIHNIAYQGLFWHHDMHLTSLPWSEFTPEGIEFYGKINLLKSGIVYSDAVTTVSRRYSEEIQTKEFGYGLEGVLAKRRTALYGILNGADYSQWNPETDPSIAKNYDRYNLAGKLLCKEDLLACYGLTTGSNAPLIGMVGRMADQKGYDLIAEALGPLMEMGAALVILGKGEEKYQRLFERLAAANRDRMGVKIAFDNALAHKIEAGADFFLMPSRYEPCGLNQIYSLRYGTAPIVRATGGLDDTVSSYDMKTLTGNGFKFEQYSTEALLEKVQEAIAVYGRSPHWRKIRENAMACDFSWTNSAREYERMYLTTLGA